MNSIEELMAKVPDIEERLGYTFADKRFLTLAFIHRSFFNEHRGLLEEHNERLEFLGDSVLELIISDYLYTCLPLEPEGFLSRVRAHIVEAGSCVELLTQLQVAEYVLLGRGERMNGGKGRETILADLFEALMGAIYLDGGIDAARYFFLRHFSEKLAEHLSRPPRNWKAELQDYAQKKHQKPPTYTILKELGPDHGKTFHVIASIDESAMGEGAGSSKKEAEQAAAEDALKKLGAVLSG
jgi:ribonuclease III